MSLTIVVGAATVQSRSETTHTTRSVAASAPTVTSAGVVTDFRDVPRASRSLQRPRPHVLPHVTCWNGRVVVEHPNVQDCPDRPKPKVVHTHTPASVPHSTRVVSSGSAYAWAHSYFAVRVANCESGGGASDHSRTYDGNPHLHGTYAGKWQFAWGTWASVGGSGDPANASESEQDYRAWRLWKRDGWSPWECAGMV